MTGLHGRAERRASGATVCLVPGLTGGQRRAVIRRLRQEASRGVGPALPLPQLAIALGLDRLRSAARIAAAVVRLHPAVTLVPGALVAAMMALFVLASADASAVVPGPRDGLAGTAVGSARARSAGAAQLARVACPPRRPRGAETRPSNVICVGNPVSR